MRFATLIKMIKLIVCHYAKPCLWIALPGRYYAIFTVVYVFVALPKSTLAMTTQALTVKITAMSINIQFFASLREQIGRSQITLPYDTPQDVLAVWAQATDSMAMPDNTLCAINMEYVKADTLVQDGDEVAFFPPVTGG